MALSPVLQRTVSLLRALPAAPVKAGAAPHRAVRRFLSQGCEKVSEKSDSPSSHSFSFLGSIPWNLAWRLPGWRGADVALVPCVEPRGRTRARPPLGDKCSQRAELFTAPVKELLSSPLPLITCAPSQAYLVSQLCPRGTPKASRVPLPCRAVLCRAVPCRDLSQAADPDLSPGHGKEHGGPCVSWCGAGISDEAGSR